MADRRVAAILPFLSVRRAAFAGVPKALSRLAGGAATANAGISVVPEDRDGNCLFKAIARQVKGDPGEHSLVRNETVGFLRDALLSPRGQFKAAQLSDEQAENLRLQAMALIDDVKDPVQVDAYLTTLSEEGTWGSMLEVYAACFVYRTSCSVWHGDVGAEPYVYDPIGIQSNGVGKGIGLLYSFEDQHWDSVTTSTRA